MNLENIITAFLTATIPTVLGAYLTYAKTKKDCNTKLEEVKFTLEKQLEAMEMKHQQDLERLEKEHQLNREDKSDDITMQLTKQFINGGLDIKQLNENMPHLMKLSKTINKSKSR